MSQAIHGLSPPARGSPGRRTPGRPGPGPIPARAGEPRSSPPRPENREAYPRPRGGAGCNRRCLPATWGLSPPARGSRQVERLARHVGRPIPARAGEPCHRSRVRCDIRAYPRPRGGARSGTRRLGGHRGLSPPARGSPGPDLGRGLAGGPIPARAGEPLLTSTKGRSSQAYPRPRGGAPEATESPSAEEGLSPPARGSRTGSAIPQRVRGPIPARAGEPIAVLTPFGFCWAYPRPRGGAILRLEALGLTGGLSPPARGSLVRRQRRTDHQGPIPARAGEPKSRRVGTSGTAAYPRPRGGAYVLGSDEVEIEGLSPPARGSRLPQRVHGPNHRPIPARAGEPESRHPPGVPSRAYPRPRGGADTTYARSFHLQGLSPPARGSRHLERCSHAVIGPIPARAGEPGTPARCSTSSSAYPRPRGGAVVIAQGEVELVGLSPPARGSPRSRAGFPPVVRPIPARAGEPSRPATAHSKDSAYPRPRGGAASGIENRRHQIGLSPPARGSHCHSKAAPARPRPIPARAGEPQGAGGITSPGTAYPRPRGGA